MTSHESACPVHADFDPHSAKFLSDPLAALRTLSPETPVFNSPSVDSYVITRYADIETILLHPETYAAAPRVPLSQPAVLKPAQGITGDGSVLPTMAGLTPPAHTRLRSAALRAFTTRQVAQMMPTIRRTVDELLDAVDRAAPFDVVSTIAFPLPARIIFSVVGGPERDWLQRQRVRPLDGTGRAGAGNRAQRQLQHFRKDARSAHDVSRNRPSVIERQAG